MAFGPAETAKLIVDLSLKGNFLTSLGKVNRELSKTGANLDKTQGRAYLAGQQIGTGIKRGALLAIGYIGTLTGVIALSVKEGSEAAKVQKIYATAIHNSGKVSAEYVKALNAQQKELENLGGIDDELIKSEQTRLIQMGLQGKQVLKITPLVLDFANATGIDLLTATKLVGKATQGNIGALSRYGVQVDKAKAKTDPFAATVDALNHKFGGTTKALSGTLPVRLAAFREAIKDIEENAGQKLLPSLTKIVDVAGRKLVPAFGKFIDRILPDITKGLDKFASLLENGGAEKGINAITDALGPLVELIKVAAAPTKAIVGAFLSLPKEVQTVLVGAFAVNKLTGGLVTNVAGGVVGAVIKGLGSIIGKNVVQPVFVTNQIPGVPGGGGGGIPGFSPTAGGSGGLSGLLKGIPIIGGALVAAEIANQTASAVGDAIKENFPNGGGIVGGVVKGITGAFSGPLGWPNLVNGIGDIANSIGQLIPLIGAQPQKDSETMRGQFGDALVQAEQDVKGGIEALRGNIASGLVDTQGTIEAARGGISQSIDGSSSAISQATYGAANGIVGAINSKDLSINQAIKINVNVSAAGVSKSVTVQNRYGPGNGSSGRDLGGPNGGGSQVHD